METFERDLVHHPLDHDPIPGAGAEHSLELVCTIYGPEDLAPEIEKGWRALEEWSDRVGSRRRILEFVFRDERSYMGDPPPPASLTGAFDAEVRRLLRERQGASALHDVVLDPGPVPDSAR